MNGRFRLLSTCDDCVPPERHFLRIELFGNQLSVNYGGILRDAFGAKDLDVQSVSPRDRVFNIVELNLVRLTQMHSQATDSFHAFVAVGAFEVLRFLMVVEYLDVVKVALTVIAPWT